MSCLDLEALRAELEEIDKRLIEILNERAVLALKIGDAKRALGLDLWDPSQEARVLKRASGLNRGPLSSEALEVIFREILSTCRAIQGPVRISFLGPEGSFSHLAALSQFGRDAFFSPCQTIAEVFRKTETGQSDWAVVPIENSTEGSVRSTMEELLSTPLMVRAEIILPISHCLVSKAPSIEKVERIYSHPQALGQCRGWLRENLPGRELVEVPSTSKGSLMAARDPSAAAIASPLACEIYGLKMLAETIQDSGNNVTRFLVLGKGMSDPTDDDKTSIIFSTRHRPGALCRALLPFAELGVNLLRLESHPIPQRPWEYMFFADLEGHASRDPLRKAMAHMEAQVTHLKLLGSYPKGRSGK